MMREHMIDINVQKAEFFLGGGERGENSLADSNSRSLVHQLAVLCHRAMMINV